MYSVLTVSEAASHVKSSVGIESRSVVTSLLPRTTVPAQAVSAMPVETRKLLLRARLTPVKQNTWIWILVFFITTKVKLLKGLIKKSCSDLTILLIGNNYTLGMQRIWKTFLVTLRGPSSDILT